MAPTRPQVKKTTSETPEQIRDRILLQALPHIAFDGWCWDVAEESALSCGYDKTMARAVFPAGLSDFVGHLSDWADRQMLENLADINPEDHRVRDRVRMAVLARIAVLAPWKESVRRAMAYWVMPPRSVMATQYIWRTADRIWDWAGDVSDDYNRYTKRGLLSGVLSATMLAWLQDDGGDPETIEAFLDRRIAHVMKMGQWMGRFKKGR